VKNLENMPTKLSGVAFEMRQTACCAGPSSMVSPSPLASAPSLGSSPSRTALIAPCACSGDGRAACGHSHTVELVQELEVLGQPPGSKAVVGGDEDLVSLDMRHD